MRPLLSLAIFLAASPFWALASTPSSSSPESVVTLRQSAKAGDVDSKYRLAILYRDGDASVVPDLQEASSWFRSAAAAGHTSAQRELALMHLAGRGVPQSFSEAQKLFFQAAQKNDEVSQYHLAVLLLTGRGGSMSVETAIGWFERASEAGHQGAQMELGRLYLEGVHVDRDVERGLKWIEAAADQGHPESMQVLGRLFEAGDLVPENPDKARMYYSRASDAGLPDAQIWMASWYEGRDPPQYGKALKLYKSAARQGSADGHFGVARLNIERLLYTPNPHEGLRHLRAAVGLNHPQAHYTIGRMYGNGSLSGGSIKALEHFQQAANLGYPPAMYELALAYYQGTSPVKKNPDMAAAWWRRASLAGHLDSQYAFSLLHLQGIGVPRNPGVAFALANVAAAQGHPDAAKVRDELLQTLSPEVLREAQELSVSLFEKYAAAATADSKAQLK